MSGTANVTHGELVRTALIAGGVLLVALVLFHGIDIASGAALFFSHDVAFSDIWHLNYPLKHFYQQELAEGRLPLWCAELGTGFPLHAEGQVGALSPLNLLLYSTLSLPLAFNWSILLHSWLAGIFTAAFARKLGASRAGGVLAGMVFALSGFFIAHLKHLNMTEAAAWIPLLLLLLEIHAGERRPRNVALISLVVAVMILAGHPQIAYNNLLIASCYALYLQARIWSKPSPHGKKRDFLEFGGGLASALLLGLLLASPQILPTLELHRLGTRQAGLTMDEAFRYPLRPAHLQLFVAPHAMGDPAELSPELEGFRTDPDDPSLFWEVTGYVGLLTLGLALLGAVLGFSRPRVKALLGGLLLALLLCLGRAGGLAYLFWFLPGFRLFRFHARFLLYVDLALAVLAGIGLTLLVRRIAGDRRRIAAIIVPALALVICYWDQQQALGNHNAKVDSGRWSTPPPVVERIRQEEAASSAPFRIINNDPDRTVNRNAHHAARGWKGDLSPYDPAMSMLDPNLNLLYDVTNLRTYFQIVPRWMQQLAEVIYLPLDDRTGRSPGVNPRILGLFNVRYVLDPHGDLVGKAPLIEEYPGEIRLYRATSLPRAYLVPHARTVYDTSPAGGQLAEPVRELLVTRFDPQSEVLIVRQPGEAAVEGGTRGARIDRAVEVVEYDSRRVHLRVEAPVDCWLVLSDTWYPGWTARIDGEEVPIHRANLVGRAIRLPAGPHDVLFRYASAPLRHGGMLAALGALGLAALLLGWRRRG